MENNSVRDKAEKIVKSKNKKKLTAVIVALGALVTVGTAYGVSSTGQAKTYTVKELTCEYTTHQHTEDCYEMVKGDLICTNPDPKHVHTDDCYEWVKTLTCGYADYTVHVHNEDCYDSMGNLVCTLPEIEPHVHDASCYTTEKVLVCGEKERQGHVHTDECYKITGGDLICTIPEHAHTDSCYTTQATLVCTTPEHVHSDSCYTEVQTLICTNTDPDHVHDESCYQTDRVLTCGMEEHTHNDSCYTYEQILTCGMEEHTHTDACYSAVEKELICPYEEGAGGHTHTAACYETQKVLTCGKLELHTHTAECYERNADGSLIKANADGTFTGKLICDIPVLEEHVHDKDCFTTRDMTADEIANMEKELEEKESTSESSEVSEATEESSEEETYTKTYKDSKYKVTVTYGKDAEIPDDAELVVTEITKESDAESYAEREEAYKDAVGDENATMDLLLDIGFYENGEEIEPKATVNVSIQFLDENGFEEGDPITMVHFAEDGAEKVDASDIEDQETTFETDSFSPFGVTILKAGGNYGIGTLSEDDGSDYTIEVGSTVTIQGTSGYSDSWSSSDTSIATVSGSGASATVTGKAVGTITITHRYKRNSRSYTYEYFEVKVTDPKVKISDKIPTEGTLNAVVTKDLESCSVVWYKATVATGATPTEPTNEENTGSYSVVTRARKSGILYNLDADGEWLNVSLDGGAKTASTETYYKIALKDEDGNIVAWSDSFKVPYYDSLQNGSFETPSLESSATNIQFSNADYAAKGGVWQTTGVGTGNQVNCDIEIVSNNTSASTYSWANSTNGKVSAYEGKQFAELNCEAAGALYQDVLTVPGTNLNWWLAHRARGKVQSTTQEFDIMYLVIMSEEAAKDYNITDISGVQEAIANGVSGVAVYTFKDDDQSWHYYTSNGETCGIDGDQTTSPYTVPEGQYLTRFYFLTGDTASGSNTVGNFLDNVGFSYDLPPAKKDQGYVKIQKYLPRMTEAEKNVAIRNLTFDVNGTTLKADAFTWEDKGEDGWVGSYSYLYDAGTSVSVSEKLSTVAYTKTSEDANAREYTWQGYTVSVDGTQTFEGTTDQDTHIETVTIPEGSTVTVAFTNTYTAEYSDFEFYKYGQTSDKTTYKPLQNAVFALYTKSADGSYQQAATATSQSDGLVTFEELDHNTEYYVKETSAPSSYDPDLMTYHLVKYDSQNKTWKMYAGAETGTGEVVNTVTQNDTVYYQIRNDKTSHVSKTAASTGVENEYIVTLRIDAQFTLSGGYSTAVWANLPGSLTDPMGEHVTFLGFVDDSGKVTSTEQTSTSCSGTAVYDANSKTITWDRFSPPTASAEHDTVDKNGHWYKGAYVLKYKVRLDVQDDGFVVDQEYALNGTTTLTYADGSTYDIAVPKESGKLYDISFTKINKEGEAKAGATFTLTGTGNNGAVTYKKTATSDINGLVSFTGLAWGTYTVQETAAPEGYRLDSTKYIVRIGAQGDGSAAYTAGDSETVINGTWGGVTKSGTDYVQENATASSWKFVNQKSDVSVVFVKQSVNGKQSLAGAQFRINEVNEDGTEGQDISSEKLITSSDENGIFSKTDMKLATGKTYVLTETQAPNGYNLLTSSVTLTITEDGTVTAGAGSNSSGNTEVEEIKDEAGNVTGYKVIVYNSTGQMLPATGGSGTTMFYLIGIGLIALAAVGAVFSLRRKRKVG